MNASRRSFQNDPDDVEPVDHARGARRSTAIRGIRGYDRHGGAPRFLRSILLATAFGLAGGSCGDPQPTGPDARPPTQLEQSMASPPPDAPRDLQGLVDDLTLKIAAAQAELDRAAPEAGGDDRSEGQRPLALRNRIERLENEWAGVERMIAHLEQLKQEGIGRPDVRACRTAMEGLRRTWNDRYSQITGRRIESTRP